MYTHHEKDTWMTHRRLKVFFGLARCDLCREEAAVFVAWNKIKRRRNAVAGVGKGRKTGVGARYNTVFASYSSTSSKVRGDVFLVSCYWRFTSLHVGSRLEVSCRPIPRHLIMHCCRLAARKRGSCRHDTIPSYIFSGFAFRCICFPEQCTPNSVVVGLYGRTRCMQIQ